MPGRAPLHLRFQLCVQERAAGEAVLLPQANNEAFSEVDEIELKVAEEAEVEMAGASEYAEGGEMFEASYRLAHPTAASLHVSAGLFLCKPALRIVADPSVRCTRKALLL